MLNVSLRRRVGIICWLVQPLGIVIELVAASVVPVSYSFADNTISDLGAVGCGTVAYPGVDVVVCSPAHALVNGSFLLGGLLLVVGALLLWSDLAVNRAAVIALVLWIVAGLSAAMTAALPLDRHLELHTWASLPGIVLQPVALGVHAAVLARAGRRRWWVGVCVAAVCFAVAVFFVLRLDQQWGGLLERTAIWPCLIGLPLLALVRPRRTVSQPPRRAA